MAPRPVHLGSLPLLPPVHCWSLKEVTSSVPHFLDLQRTDGLHQSLLYLANIGAFFYLKAIPQAVLASGLLSEIAEKTIFSKK